MDMRFDGGWRGKGGRMLVVGKERRRREG